MALQAERGSEAYQAANRALALEPYSPHALGTRAAAQLTGVLLDLRGATADAERALLLFPELPVARARPGQGESAASGRTGASMRREP